MVDFNTLAHIGDSGNSDDPLVIFNELPKSNKVNDLYNVQAEILREWYADLRDENDIVIELNTGGGKTLVGLLIALSIMRETGEGVLYLVENKQLADQVALQAKELGIPAKTYQGGKKSIDSDFDNGKSILVGAYQCLFNGMSVFGIRGSSSIQPIGGIIVDDAHASLNAIRDAFTMFIPAEGNGLYKQILNEFRGAFAEIEKESTFQEFMEGVGNGVVEIPYWRWVGGLDYVSGLVLKERQNRVQCDDQFSNELKFKWPLLKDNLKYCQAVVSQRGITISSLYPNVAMIPSFANAKKRIYMSATITDYGDMLRAYDIRNLAPESVVAPRTVAGVGRRMVLGLSKEMTQSTELAALASSLTSTKRGVVRLANRQGTDGYWPSIRFYEPIGHAQVISAVRALRSGTASDPISFVNRYNGIDLPDDSCRLLILRGLPAGGSDCDELMSIYLKDSELITQRLAQRIEQGLGRGTRGASDHCVVLLEGDDLIDWVKRERNRKYFTPALRAQLAIGDVIANEINSIDDFCEVVRQDLDNDESWTKFHAVSLSNVVSSEVADRFGRSYDSARIERKAFTLWSEHRQREACDMLIKKADEYAEDPCYRGWLLHLASRVAHDGGGLERANELQRQAHSFNSAIPYSPFCENPSVPDWAVSQVELILDFMQGSNGIVSALNRFDHDTASLIPEARHKDFEIALMNLGRYLGFESGRADDNGVGSDVYWITPDGFGLALEAKNEKAAETPLHKGEASQLRTSRDWLAQNHPDIEVVPVSVHPSVFADKNASASNLRVMTLDKLADLKMIVRALIANIVNPNQGFDEAAIARHVVEQGLGGRGVVEKYTHPFIESQR